MRKSKRSRSFLFVITFLQTVLPQSSSFTLVSICNLNKGSIPLSSSYGGGMMNKRWKQKQQKRSIFSSSRLFGLKEWRDAIHKKTKRQHQQQHSNSGSTILPLLAFGVDDDSGLLVPGQSLNLVLKEGRFLDLFQDSIDDYHSMVGLVRMDDDGHFLPYMALCAVEDLDVNIGYRGKLTMDVTLRAVSRAVFSSEFTQTKPILMGFCNEIKDDNIHTINKESLDICSDMANQIETIILSSSTINNSNDNNATGIINRHQYMEAYKSLLNTTTTTSKIIDRLNTISWSVFAAIPFQQQDEKQKILVGTSLEERLSLGLKILWNQQYNNNKASTSTTTLLYSSEENNNAFQ